MFTLIESLIALKNKSKSDGYGFYIDAILLTIAISIGTFLEGKKVVEDKFLEINKISKTINEDTHYVLKYHGQYYIVRDCENDRVEIINLNENKIFYLFDNHALKITNNGEEYICSYDSINIYSGSEISLDNEEILINNGAKVLKK